MARSTAVVAELSYGRQAAAKLQRQQRDRPFLAFSYLMTTALTAIGTGYPQANRSNMTLQKEDGLCSIKTIMKHS
jgi:hypothetical protein